MLDRRLLLGLLSAAAIAPTRGLSQQSGTSLSLKRVRTGILEIAYEDSGPEAGFPVLLMHGFPYDPRCYDEVVPPLVAAGYRTIVPYLRGFGATRFLAAETPRSGQQAAIGRDSPGPHGRAQLAAGGAHRLRLGRASRWRVARSRGTYPFSSRPNSNLSSTSRPPKPSASPSWKRCWPPLMR
jgi:hypothetical protein